jgi:hypothetical protein
MIKLRPPATHEQLQHAGEGEIDEGEKHLPMLSEPQPTFVSRAGTVIFTPLTEAAARHFSIRASLSRSSTGFRSPARAERPPALQKSLLLGVPGPGLVDRVHVLVRLERVAAVHLGVSFGHLRPAPKSLSGPCRSRLAS